MDSVADNLLDIQEKIASIANQQGRDPGEIRLVAVTKSRGLSDVMPAYHAGCRDFGENRAIEALEKIPQAPSDLRWHLIGTLQTKKVKKVIGKFHLIHSVDTPKLAATISKASQDAQRTTDILLQSNTSGEEAKHGFTPQEWEQAFEEILDLPAIHIKGLMTMAPFTTDENSIRHSFSSLRELRDRLEEKYNISLHELSMGMTNDYHIAIEEGATIVRVGTAIFGPLGT